MKNVRTKVKKLVALLAVMVMVLAMGIPVSAADTGSITITPKDNGTHTFTAYQIFKGDLSDSGVLSNVEWADGVTGESILSALKADTTIGSLFTNCTTAASVAEALNGIVNNSDQVKAFAEVMADNATSLGTGQTLTQGTDGKYKIADLSVGYYLVTDDVTGTGAKASDTILQVVGDVNIDAKADIPQVTKTAGKDSYGIGDEVEYTLTATVPDYNENGGEGYAYKVAFTDTMSPALDLIYTYVANQSEVTSGVVVMMGDSDVTSAFAIRYDEHILTISCDDISKIEGISATSVFTVTYKAKINDTYVDGDVFNRVTLVTKDYTSPEIEEKVFPITLQINKVDGETDVALQGAEFQISRENGGTTEYLQVSNGKVNAWVSENGEASTLTTDENGQVSVVGLEAGTYTLTETKAPAGGYNLPTGDFTLVITANVNQTGDALDDLYITVNNGQQIHSTDKATVVATIENNKGAQLPSTGGIGTTIFYIVGGILVVGAAVLLIVRKRMSAEK